MYLDYFLNDELESFSPLPRTCQITYFGLLACLCSYVFTYLTCMLCSYILLAYSLRAWYPPLPYLLYIWKVKFQKFLCRIFFWLREVFRTHFNIYYGVFCDQYLIYTHLFYLYRYQFENLHFEINSRKQWGH